jgi:molybdate transport system ATP-binding protein
VADLVGIQNRYHGEWVGPADQSGWGLLRWVTGDGGNASAPVLKVRDKGKIDRGQAVSWVISGDGIALLDHAPMAQNEFAAVVSEARHLGEITLVALALDAVPGELLRLTLTGPQRLGIHAGGRIGVRLDLTLVHVMPSKQLLSALGA